MASDRISNTEIRALVEKGKIWPLERILQKYQPQVNGRLLDLEVENEHGSLMYEMKFMLQNGRVVELKVDATDGRLIEREYDD